MTATTEKTFAGWNAEFSRRRQEIEKDPHLRKALDEARRAYRLDEIASDRRHADAIRARFR